MAGKPAAADLPTQSFANSSDFASWLDTNHLTAPGLYVKLAKKPSGISSISAAEAVEEALCYGWIDGRANSVDETWWTMRYTPRRAKSIWSQKNVATVARLIEEGRMRPAGLAQVQAAKSDGRWEKAYAGPKDMVVPDDLAKRLLEESVEVKKYWEGLNKSSKYPYLHKLAVVSAKGREKKLESVVVELRSAANDGVQKKVPLKKEATMKKAKSTESAATLSTVVKKDNIGGVEQDLTAVPRREGLRSPR